MSKFRPLDFALRWSKRPKTLRCERGKTKIKVKPRGCVPKFCCQTCRQRAYERQKWQRLTVVEGLAQDLATAKVRSAIRAEVRAQLLPLLKQFGLDLPKPPHPGSPPTPQRRGHLHVVKQGDSPK